MHITSRTERRLPHLATDEAKELVLGSLLTYAHKGIFRLLAYVLMDNHFHFAAVVEDADGFPKALGRLKGWTSHELQAATGARPPIWERRYDDNVIQNDRELLQVIQYIHDNPVRAGIVTRAEDYQWSSARQWALQAFPDL
ncbi:MAG: transposase [Phycisphaerae bacterium]